MSRRYRRSRRVRNIVPFDVNVKGERMSVTWDSIIWFGVVTTLASIAGSYIWEYWVQPNLSPAQAPGSNKSAESGSA
jgi:hypothetical protein